jgi:hypothetical protein
VRLRIPQAGAADRLFYRSRRGAGCEHLAENHPGNFSRLHSASRQQSFDDRRAQLMRGQGGKLPAKFSDGSAGSGNDHDSSSPEYEASPRIAARAINAVMKSGNKHGADTFYCVQRRLSSDVFLPLFGSAHGGVSIQFRP